MYYRYLHSVLLENSSSAFRVRYSGDMCQLTPVYTDSLLQPQTSWTVGEDGL